MSIFITNLHKQIQLKLVRHLKKQSVFIVVSDTVCIYLQYRSTDYRLLHLRAIPAPPSRQGLATPRGLNPDFLFSCNNGLYAAGISENSICRLTPAHRAGRKTLCYASLVDYVFVFGFTHCYSISLYSLIITLPGFQSKILPHDSIVQGVLKKNEQYQIGSMTH